VSGAARSASAFTGLPELELGPGALFIADLHLDLMSQSGPAEFVAWLAALPRIPDLVILGDLFDVWVGPAQARLPAAVLVLDALRAFRERGARIHVVPGNRDFLLDRSFEERSGARVQAEGFVAHWRRADGSLERCLAIHGDLLCTLDRGYQRLRRVLRSGPLLWLAPRLPLWVGAHVAKRLRRASVQAIQAKLPEEKSMQEPAVRAAAIDARATSLICGHAHSAKDVRLADGPRWIVLDAFGGERDAAGVEPSGELVCRAHAAWSRSGESRR
jgi:UDP-2,3-diacylglucosamine hydrolase